MKRTLCLFLLMSSVAYANTDESKTPVQDVKENGMHSQPPTKEQKSDHSFFDLDVSLCDDEDLLHHNVELPEESALRQWMTRFGCAILAKCYAAQDLMHTGYNRTKRIFLRLSMVKLSQWWKKLRKNMTVRCVDYGGLSRVIGWSAPTLRVSSYASLPTS